MDIVTSTSLRVVEKYGSRSYTLRPPTYGEAGDLTARAVGTVRPGPAIVAEVTRQALERVLGAAAAPHVAAVTAHEDADDALQAVLLTRPLEEEPDSAKSEWRRDLRAAQQALLAAERRRRAAEHLVAADPAVVEIRGAQLRAQLEERLAVVRLCLVGWEGEGLPAWAPAADGYAAEEQLRTLPAGDIAGLADRCNALLRPDRATEKN